MLKTIVRSIVVACALAGIAAGQQAATVDSPISSRVSKAASVLREMTISDSAIPDELLQRAEAVAVIPGAIKGASDLGGSYGKGLVAERLADGRWTAPVFIRIGGGRWEPKAGASSSDIVLVFTNADALRTLEEGTDLRLGVDASIVPGHVGRNAEPVTDVKLEAAVWAYSRSEGLVAGIDLNGAVLDVDDNANSEVYGQDVTARKVLLGETILANATVKPFIDALQRATAVRKVTQR